LDARDQPPTAQPRAGSNSIAPTLTDMEKKAWDAEEESAPVNVRIPPHRLGTPWELADLGLFLSSPASDVICGQVFFIGGGYGAV